jgi:HemY protein
MVFAGSFPDSRVPGDPPHGGFILIQKPFSQTVLFSLVVTGGGRQLLHLAQELAAGVGRWGGGGLRGGPGLARELLAHGAAIDAQEFQQARAILSPLTEKPTQRICLLMAELEASENGDVGKAREWAAKALRAPRDPAWIADGVVSEHWAPVSPVTGKLDAYVWDVPPGVTATPLIEHEAERLRAAIAAVPPPKPAVVPAPEPVKVVEPEPAPAVETAKAEPAPSRSEPKAAPIIAMPPLPDDPGPLRPEEDVEARRPAAL